MSVRALREAAPRPLPVVSAPTALPAPGAGTRSKPTVEPVAPVSPFARLLRGLGDEATRGESAVRQATAATSAGRDLGATELLALQGAVYRYSEAVDLASKLVDRAANGVKTVVSGQ